MLVDVYFLVIVSVFRVCLFSIGFVYGVMGNFVIGIIVIIDINGLVVICY